ncbi:STAS domain-containing protein [Actinoplanes sp. NPDC051494]|uniref:STAS domain-containing protein n=1 Tax=Actinoplanes sp. NPDC051494 TaxID=3363907 RepID=UPI0037A3AE2C
MGIPVSSTRGANGTAAVSLSGEIDYANSDEVAQGLRDAVAQWSPEEIRVDLSGATFIDSTGLGALIEGYRAATTAGCRFVVTNPSDSFRRVLTVTGMIELFGMTEDARLSEATGA